MDLLLYLIILAVGVVVGFVLGQLTAKAESNGFRAVAEDRATRIATLDAAIAERDGRIQALASQLSAQSGGFQALDRMAPLAVEQVVARLRPFSEKMDEFKRNQSDHLIHLRDIATRIHQDVAQNAKINAALKTPAGVGKWGEMQLRRLVELAGMQEHCDFEEQASVSAAERRFRPDMVIHLPHGRDIIVDSKAILIDLPGTAEAPDDRTRQALVANVRARLTELSGKSYQEQFTKSPDFVVAFLPEYAFHIAVQTQRSLLEEFAGKNVLLASPTTLIALLKSASFGWRQFHSARSADEIAQLGKQLYQTVLDFAGQMQNLGTSLDKSVQSFNRALRQLDTAQPLAMELKRHSGASAPDMTIPRTLTRTSDFVHAATEPRK